MLKWLLTLKEITIDTVLEEVTVVERIKIDKIGFIFNTHSYSVTKGNKPVREFTWSNTDPIPKMEGMYESLLELTPEPSDEAKIIVEKARNIKFHPVWPENIGFTLGTHGYSISNYTLVANNVILTPDIVLSRNDIMYILDRLIPEGKKNYEESERRKKESTKKWLREL